MLRQVLLFTPMIDIGTAIYLKTLIINGSIIALNNMPMEIFRLILLKVFELFLREGFTEPIIE